MSSLRSSLEPAKGFHRTFKTTITLSSESLFGCSLHSYHKLPPIVFVDPYELAHYRDAYTFQQWGTLNLELPVSAVSPEGSAVLLNVTLPSDNSNVAVQLPVHFRYPRPGADGYFQEEIPWPIAFIACPGSSECPSGVIVLVLSAGFNSGGADALSGMPTELTSLFNSASITPIPPTQNVAFPVELVRLPVGSYGDIDWVEFGTIAVILFAFTILLRASYNKAQQLKSHSKVE